VARVARRAAEAEGAGETGLARMIEMHAASAAGDAAITISLAGTLFFQVPTGEARDKVALFLGLTMLPFALIAPLVGPFLDRFSHGRRWAIGGAMAFRAFLAWNLALAVQADSILLFPAALGVLVASKGYTVARAAAVPRVAPPSLGLVKTNSRVSLAGVLGAAVSAPIAFVASLFGPEWSLRYGCVLFTVATVLAILLPREIDSEVPERRVFRRTISNGLSSSGHVVMGLRSNAGLRMLSGFLLFFMAFLLRTHQLPGWNIRSELAIALVAGAAAVGSTSGIALGSLLKSLDPRRAVVVSLATATLTVIVTAIFYSAATALILGLITGLTQTYGKLSLDSLIQREVPEPGRTSAFARSETLLQFAWVIGGFIGIAVPLVPWAGLSIIAVALVAVLVWVVRPERGRRPTPTTGPTTG
jgi:MFS family permease